MKKLLLSIFLALLITVPAFAQGTSSPPLRVAEADGTPSGTAINRARNIDKSNFFIIKLLSRIAE
jgi:hypothetical protein